MNKVLFHTIEQPDSDTTTFILSCNRLEILDVTINSFLRTADYQTKMVIVDDSAEPGIFDQLVKKYGSFCDVICFPRNRSQWWALDFMVSYCDSEYIFYLEDDWELMQPGYLNASKEILQKYRDIGTIDISWRTFEWQGIDSYTKKLIDNKFFFKKPWQITKNHLHWYGWIGSPNLKRRDDLILLGRIEKWHAEWNIDRKFLALGFKAVFLDGEYARHLGDTCSRMAGKRPDDSKTPESYYPPELMKKRIWPTFDYSFLDREPEKYISSLKRRIDNVNKITFVSAALNINRHDRGFDAHYIDSLEKILSTEYPIVLFAEEQYHEKIKKMRRDGPLTLIKFEKEDLDNFYFYNDIQKIITDTAWIKQADWMQSSVIRSEYYISLTLMKQYLLEKAIRLNRFGSDNYYWIDAGMFSSYGIPGELDDYNFENLPSDKLFMPTFWYNTDTEIHGYNINKMTEICKLKPNYVCRATIFGGNKDAILKMTDPFYQMVKESIDAGCIGTEESIYTMLSIKRKNMFNLFEMPNGDIKNLTNTMRET